MTKDEAAVLKSEQEKLLASMQEIRLLNIQVDNLKEDMGKKIHQLKGDNLILRDAMVDLNVLANRLMKLARENRHFEEVSLDIQNKVSKAINACREF